MFLSCSSLTSLDVSTFDTSNVAAMTSMFSRCSSLRSLTFGNNFVTSSVTDLDYMFQYCRSLTTLDVSGFDTSNVTNMCAMFNGCRSLESLAVSNFKTSNVTNMSNMFKNCSSLTSLDVSTFNTSKVTDMSDMFNGCSSLKNLTFGQYFTTPACTGFARTFSNCSSMRYLDFYDSNDGVLGAFKNSNINRTANSEDALFGSVSSGLPMTTVVYLPHGIKKSDYTNYTDLPNLVFNDNGTLKATIYYSADKVDIELPHEFKATTAEYSRTMNAATQYGTAILPYAFTSNESVQAYTLTAEHTGTMYFEEAASVPANTPFFYSKKTPSATSVNFNNTVANNGITVAAVQTTSAAEGGEPYGANAVLSGWTAQGYYITEVIDATSDSPTTNTFYIAGDKFWRATGTLQMYPHRVTYQGQWQYEPGNEAPAMLSIFTMAAPDNGDELPTEVTKAIDAAHQRALQQGARDIYDLQGRRHSELRSGVNIIRMADGSTVKVVKR